MRKVVHIGDATKLTIFPRNYEGKALFLHNTIIFFIIPSLLFPSTSNLTQRLKRLFSNFIILFRHSDLYSFAKARHMAGRNRYGQKGVRYRSSFFACKYTHFFDRMLIQREKSLLRLIIFLDSTDCIDCNRPHLRAVVPSAGVQAHLPLPRLPRLMRVTAQGHISVEQPNWGSSYNEN